MPEFFSLLDDAYSSAEEVDAFDKDTSSDDAEMASDDRLTELMAEERRAVEALVKFVQAKGDAILLWMEARHGA